jgi:hypothetical protein
VFSGKFSKSFLIASRPPAEAPTPAIGKACLVVLLRVSFFCFLDFDRFLAKADLHDVVNGFFMLESGNKVCGILTKISNFLNPSKN